jgi:4-amino-4-deoxy-L-arabinose transferase-like glycosyltransferase
MMSVRISARLLSLLPQLEEDQRIHAVLVGLLVIAFVLRLAVALLLPLDYRLRDDAVEYVSVAEHMLEDGIYGEEPGTSYAVVPPGYPLFVAGILALSGRSLIGVRLAQVIVGVLAVWFTYLAGKSTFSARIGLGAAAICAIYPPFVVYIAPYLTEALYIPLFVLYLVFFLPSLKEPSVKHTAFAGVGFGLTMLTKETLIAFPVVLPLILWWAKISFRQALRYLLVFATVTLLVLSPWLARNYLTFGHVFYTSRIAYIQYELTGTGYLAPRFEDEAEERKQPVTESDENYDYYQQYGRTSDLWSVRFALHQPVTYLRYLFNRLIEFWLHPNGLWSLPEILVMRAAYIAGHVGMLGLATWQMIVGLRRRDAVTGAFALILLFVTVVGVFLRRPNPRYNLPFLPILFIFSARGALALIERSRSREPLPAQRAEPKVQDGRD